MDTDADELIEDAGLEDDPFWKTSCEFRSVGQFYTLRLILY